MDTGGSGATPPIAVVAIDLRSPASTDANVRAITGSLRGDRGPVDLRIRYVDWGAGAPRLLDGDGDPPPESSRGLPVSLAVGGIGGAASASRLLLEEGAACRAEAVAFIAGEHPGLPAGWARALLAPIFAGGFDFVSLAYDRHPLDGALNTGVVYPFVRAVYGAALRQPLGGEVALSMRFGARLLEDPDWRRDPASAGGDAWLVAKALTSGARVCEAHLGHWPRPPLERSDPSEVLAHVLGLVFTETEREPSRWQRVQASRPVERYGVPEAPAGPAPRPDVGKLVDALRLGLRELTPVWSQFVPPGALLALQRAAAAPAPEFRIEDRLWARLVFDFAVAHSTRLVERSQLLRSMTPIYLGWVASFANELQGLAPAAAEERVERLCRAFEAEKRYLVGRWRWPESFIP
ncbi:MAG TPA: hypothetical protein VLT47_09100 [Anaeromyxobacteraceae bacterium]|nr:hypothetical protein [Anaeromyxobacteraceae bacterium]